MKRTVFCLIGGLLLVCGAQAQAATATFLGSCTSGTSHACQFDASGSSCPGSSILTYSWSFGDASASLGGSLMNHTYTAPLSSYYKVDLLVYCADGSQATASRYVCVNIGFWGCIVPNRGWN
ncbi:MAG TPA: PKD domain-containing protein [Thermoanaerobaculia bacterium]